jgi:hypothetical protein
MTMMLRLRASAGVASVKPQCGLTPCLRTWLISACQSPMIDSRQGVARRRNLHLAQTQCRVSSSALPLPPWTMLRPWTRLLSALRKLTMSDPFRLRTWVVLRGLIAAVALSRSGALLAVCNPQASSASAKECFIKLCRTPMWPVAGADVYQLSIWFRDQPMEPGFIQNLG